MSGYGKLAKLTAWLIPSKELRARYRDYCFYMDSKLDFEHVKSNYENVLRRLKTQDKIKVVFLVRENQKWTYQSLYEEFEKNEKFEPLVLVSMLELVRKGKDKTRNNLTDSFEFFKSKGMKVDYAYKNGGYVDLKEYKPDIVFYDQPWDLPEIQQPRKVSEYALTCYSSYSYELFDCIEDYTASFHKFLYRYFTENEFNKNRYESYRKGNSENCVVTGYPKLDAYLKTNEDCNVWRKKDEYKIIYAPHHSIDSKGIRLSTFLRNGKLMLELAKSHPNTTWVFKPHPRLKYVLLRTKIMNEKEIEEYWNEWKKIGAVFEGGDYMSLFKTSDLMITDGCSFLTEYLLTGKPLIRLINKKGIKLNKLGTELTEGYYLADNNEELRKLFNQLVIEKKDNKANLRNILKNKIAATEGFVAVKIIDNIMEEIK